jgi:hypothetical protein
MNLLRERLAIELKTGDASSVIDVLRDHLQFETQTNLIPSTRSIRRSNNLINRHFIALLRPTRTYSGFRVDLVLFVRLTVFLLLGRDDLDGIPIDIWGDALARGSRDVTRFAFRILSQMPNNLSQQSTNAVFTFAAFFGKDNRFVMEQNIGWEVVGDQKTSWLYIQTKCLADLGCQITLSGDVPFSMRLVLDRTQEQTKKSASNVPMYVPDEANSADVLPTATCPETGHRTNLKLPLRDSLPLESLIYLPSTCAVCPDLLHMMVRNTENDLRKMAQKMLDDKKPHAQTARIKLEENISLRGVKNPRFQFIIENGRIGSVSLSGKDAHLILADTEAFEGSTNKVCDLYDGVWFPDEFAAATDKDKPFQIIKSLHPDIIKQTQHGLKIPMLHAAELMRRSLYRCIRLLRQARSLNTFDVEKYKFWAESYYQITMCIFTKDGLTPYKLKLCMLPQILNQNFLISPWHHMVEALEKSNHHANKDYHTRTMRSGGNFYSWDPNLADILFSFDRVFKLSGVTNPGGAGFAQTAVDFTQKVLHSATYANIEDEEFAYTHICKQPVSTPRLEPGPKPDSLILLGMRFFTIGNFTGTDAASSANLQAWITEMGGTILSSDQAKRLLTKHSTTPHCYCVVKSLKDLEAAIIPSAKGANKGKLAQTDTAKLCRMFAAGDWKFLKWNYVKDCRDQKACRELTGYVIETEQLENWPKITVADLPHVLRQQTTGVKEVSGFTAVKRTEKKTDLQTPESITL